MPFRNGMKIVLTNETGTDRPLLFFDIDYTLGDAHDPTTLYFHAHWRRERPTTIKRDYEFLPRVQGRGRFLGVNVGVIPNQAAYFKSWWGEGECKIYLDGDGAFPTLCGTGTEDYIGTGWGQGQYTHLYQGCHLADYENYQFAFYRYHVPDPVYFHHDIRVTMQQIGWCNPGNIRQLHEAGQTLPDITDTPGLFERQDDWSSCAYFYLDRSTNNLPALAPVAERTFGLTSNADAQKRADV